MDRKKRVSTIFGAICVVLVILSIIMFRLGIRRAEENYNAAEEAAYSRYHQRAFDRAEAKNHVSNDIIISIDDVREISRLEVLNVGCTEVVIKNADEKDKITSWLEVQGTGVFTVDLSVAEFIVDDARQTVLVRLPKPALTACKVSGTGQQFWNNGRLISNGSVAEGFRLSQEQLREGRLKLEDTMKKSRNYHKAAEDAAKDMVDWIVRKWNPNIPELQVIVEFRESF